MWLYHTRVYNGLCALGTSCRANPCKGRWLSGVNGLCVPKKPLHLPFDNSPDPPLPWPRPCPATTTPAHNQELANMLHTLLERRPKCREGGTPQKDHAHADLPVRRRPLPIPYYSTIGELPGHVNEASKEDDSRANVSVPTDSSPWMTTIPMRIWWNGHRAR